MVLITREQAICMFYHQPYNKQKAEELLKMIENIHTEICYKDDPTKPFLCSTKSINAFEYHQYPSLLKKDIHVN
ncbi:uncharacterized protein B0P05DRAFT_526342, partial [Gilbertella persicaria]